MNISLSTLSKNLPTRHITGSKSETNRWLLLQALYPEINLNNISNAEDSKIMQNALAKVKTSNYTNQIPIIDIHHAGTAMRFLTAFLAIQSNQEVVLTGSNRMKERPIKLLVEALKQLGAEIHYLEQAGYPPLKIKGQTITKHLVSLPAHVSSQYISALLLIAPKLKKGLKLTLQGDITSEPYIKMTLQMLNEIGVNTKWQKKTITVDPLTSLSNFPKGIIESDWSSASYWFSLVALSEIGTQITLKTFKQDSIQGDSALPELYKAFGIKTVFNPDYSVTLTKISMPLITHFSAHLINTPDLAQTIAVSCFGLGISCNLTGLHTLKIKETDRLEALKNELIKLGAKVSISQDSFYLMASKQIISGVSIKTYQDHRMAMAFAVLGLKTNLVIEDSYVVNKSYPNFWEDLKIVGLSLNDM